MSNRRYQDNKQFIIDYQKKTYAQLNIRLNKTTEKDVIDLITTLREQGVPIRSLFVKLLRDYGKKYLSQNKS